MISYLGNASFCLLGISHLNFHLATKLHRGGRWLLIDGTRF